MKTQGFFKVFGVVVASAFVLAACRAEEQGRITRYKPGVYLGKKDSQLGMDRREQLRQHATRQGTATFLTGGGARVKGTTDAGKLSTRAQGQRQP